MNRAGEYDADSMAATPCEPCPAGTFTASAFRCDGTCPAGTYAGSGSTSAADCQACLPGQYDDDLAAASPCLPCAAGSFTNDPLHCEEACPVGTYAPEGSFDCTPCRTGTVDADRSAATTCTACPAGNFSAGPLHCEGCPVSTYSLAESTGCVACPVGRVTVDVPSDSVDSCVCAGDTLSLNENFLEPGDEPTYGCVTCAAGQRHWEVSEGGVGPTYLGCYVDGPTRDLDYAETRLLMRNVAVPDRQKICADHCDGYRYMGLQYLVRIISISSRAPERTNTNTY
jgi:hypothetical protein